MALVKRIVASVVSILIGFLITKISGPVSLHVSAPFEAACAKEQKKVFNNEILDNFLCVTVPLFEASLVPPTSILIYGNLIALFFVLNVMWFVEASRKGASILISIYALVVFMIAVQVNGVCTAFPLLYMPVYLLVNAGDRSSKSSEGKAVSVFRVVAIMVILFLTFIPTVAMLVFEGEKLRVAIAVFQFVPIVAPLLVIPFTSSTTNKRAEGHKAVESAYLLAAGACFAWQIMAVLFIAKDPSLITQLISLVVDPTQRMSAVFLMLIDGLGLWVGLLYFSFVEDGLKAFLATLLGSILLGPGGATALYFIYRERQLAGKLDGAKKKSA